MTDGATKTALITGVTGQDGADLAWLVVEVVGYDGPVVTDSSKTDGTPRKLMDNAKLARLGWAPKTELRDGIAKSYAAFLGGEGRGL